MTTVLKQRILFDGEIIVITIVQRIEGDYQYTRVRKTVNQEQSDIYGMKKYDKAIENQFQFDGLIGATPEQILQTAEEIDNTYRLSYEFQQSLDRRLSDKRFKKACL